jgi:ribonuclease VapC
MTVVLDASALLAVMFDEPGQTTMLPLLKGATISAVNLSEVYARVIERGKTLTKVQAAFEGLEIGVASFDEEQATLTAMLRAETRQLGLSFGDRACLALGRHLRCPVYTADRIWGKLGIDLDIVVIR